MRKKAIWVLAVLALIAGGLSPAQADEPALPVASDGAVDPYAEQVKKLRASEAADSLWAERMAEAETAVEKMVAAGAIPGLYQVSIAAKDFAITVTTLGPLTAGDRDRVAGRLTDLNPAVKFDVKPKDLNVTGFTGSRDADYSNHFGGSGISDYNDRRTIQTSAHQPGYCTTGFIVYDWVGGVKKKFTSTAYHCGADEVDPGWDGEGTPGPNMPPLQSNIWWWDKFGRDAGPYIPTQYHGTSDSYGRASRWGDVRVVTDTGQTYGGGINPSDNGPKVWLSASAYTHVQSKDYVVEPVGQGSTSGAVIGVVGPTASETGYYFVDRTYQLALDRWTAWYYAFDQTSPVPYEGRHEHQNNVWFWADAYERYDNRHIELGGNSGGPLIQQSDPGWGWGAGAIALGTLFAGNAVTGMATPNYACPVEYPTCDRIFVTDIGRIEAVLSATVSTNLYEGNSEIAEYGISRWQ